MNGVAPEHRLPFSAELLSSHRLDNASRDNAGETRALDIDHTFYMYIRGIRYRIFFRILRKYRSIYFRSRCHTSEARLLDFLEPLEAR